MIELVMVIAAVVLAAKVADIENKSPWLWGGLAFGLCFASMFFPYLPFIRVFIAAVLVIVLMMTTKLFGKA